MNDISPKIPPEHSQSNDIPPKSPPEYSLGFSKILYGAPLFKFSPFKVSKQEGQPDNKMIIEDQGPSQVNQEEKCHY